MRNNAIPEMYERVKEVVITHMKEAENNIVHFTTSIWISSQTREYLTLTAHWVTYNSYVQPQGQDFHCSALLSISQIDCDYNMIDMLFDETVGIDNMVKSLKEAMASRMSSILCDPRYMWATMLDPRYKTSLFTEEEAQQCKQDLIQELEASLSTSAETKGLPSNGCSEVPDPASNRDLGNNDNFWALMDNIRNKIKKEEQPKSSELAARGNAPLAVGVTAGLPANNIEPQQEEGDLRGNLSGKPKRCRL
ncbi:hypothetical protein Z043_108250 [Scleropages formosus]|uniref:Uncharacterized protein n=1 Tax=Scleropages formosus TaxID=113540 RepID=A0A0N8K0P6_SCLFO|nr:hypothetical protein Z043_108250 [Scleropages formosus]